MKNVENFKEIGAYYLSFPLFDDPALAGEELEMSANFRKEILTVFHLLVVFACPPLEGHYLFANKKVVK